MKRRVGAFVGKFYPPHIGHAWVVDTVVNDLDMVYIIISKNEIRNSEIKESQNFNNLGAELIKSWFEKHYENNPKVKVAIFDETGLKPYPEDRDVWADKFKKEFPMVNVKIADESYREYNQQYFPEYEFYPIERDVIPIHSTQIRNNLEDNFEFLIKEAKEYFKEIRKGEKL